MAVSSDKEVINGGLLRVGCGSLERQSGTRFAQPARHRKCCRISIGLGPICAVSGKGYGYGTAT